MPLPMPGDPEYHVVIDGPAAELAAPYGLRAANGRTTIACGGEAAAYAVFTGLVEQMIRGRLRGELFLCAVAGTGAARESQDLAMAHLRFARPPQPARTENETAGEVDTKAGMVIGLAVEGS